MEEIRAFCDQLAAKAKQKTGSGNMEQAVRAFIALFDGNNPSAARLLPRSDAEKTSRSLARRNDVRVQPYLGVNTCPSLAAGTNIFADSRLHIHAAASLAARAQAHAGFDARMPTSEVGKRLQAYISQLTSAPHWNFVSTSSSPVIHDVTNPRELTRSLIASIAKDLQATAATEGIAAATNSVNLLASTLSMSSEISDTLYAVIGIFREEPESGPVFYSVSIVSLRMNHERYRKSRALATDQAQTNTLVLRLDSSILVENESLYSRLAPASVDDWFHSLNI